MSTPSGKFLYNIVHIGRKGRIFQKGKGTKA